MSEEKKKHPGGRPTKYNAQFHPQLVRLLAEKGYTEPEIAEQMNVGISTITNWKKTYPEFLSSLNAGREGPDDLVEQALYKAALGEEYDAEKPMVVSDGNGMGSHIENAVYKTKIPGNVTAMKFWLINRRPDKWREKQEVELAGKDGAAIPISFTFVADGKPDAGNTAK